MNPSQYSPILDDLTRKRLIDEIVPELANLAHKGTGRKSRAVDIGKAIGQVIAAALLAYAAMVYQGTQTSAKQTEPSTGESERVAVLESQVDTIKSDLSEMKADIKTLLQRDAAR